MPKLRRARIKPFTGDIYFQPKNSLGEGAETLAQLEDTLHTLGLSVDLVNINGNGISTGFDGTTPAPIEAIIGITLPSLTANINVINAYTGPVVSPAGALPQPIVTAYVTTTTTRALVGHPIMIYSVPQIVQLTYPASLEFGGIFLDNYPLNRTSFRLVRGVQNEINFYVRDVDRKPVTLASGETLTINIVDLATNSLLMSRVLTTIDSTNGIYLLTTYPSEMDTWPTSVSIRWSMMYNRIDGSTVLLWTDRNYSPYSTLTLSEGPIPGPFGPTVVASGSFTNYSGVLYSPSLIGSANHGYVGGVQTFVITMSGYTGSVRIDASNVSAPVNSNTSSDWFQVDLQSYTDNTGNVVLNETGNYLWMRMVLTPASGSVTQFQYKS